MAYKTTNRFVPGVSNTICDITGFKKKSNEVVRRWDGFYCIPEACHPRQPQDFPPNILKTRIFEHTRFEQVIENAAADPLLTSTTLVLDSDLNIFEVTSTVLNSSGAEFAVVSNVKDSAGNEYPVFTVDSLV